MSIKLFQALRIRKLIILENNFSPLNFEPPPRSQDDVKILERQDLTSVRGEIKEVQEREADGNEYLSFSCSFCEGNL